MRRIAKFFAGPTEPDPRIGFVVLAVVIFAAQTVVFFQDGRTWLGVLGIVIVAGWVQRVVQDVQLRRRRRAGRAARPSPSPAPSGH